MPQSVRLDTILGSKFFMRIFLVPKPLCYSAKDYGFAQR
jgi:hypothetical protein